VTVLHEVLEGDR